MPFPPPNSTDFQEWVSNACEYCASTRSAAEFLPSDWLSPISLWFSSALLRPLSCGQPAIPISSVKFMQACRKDTLLGPILNRTDNAQAPFGTKSPSSGRPFGATLEQAKDGPELVSATGAIGLNSRLVRSQTLYPTELRARSKTLHCQQFTASSSSISTSSFGSFGGTCEDSLDALSISCETI